MKRDWYSLLMAGTLMLTGVTEIVSGITTGAAGSDGLIYVGLSSVLLKLIDKDTKS